MKNTFILKSLLIITISMLKSNLSAQFVTKNYDHVAFEWSVNSLMDIVDYEISYKYAKDFVKYSDSQCSIITSVEEINTKMSKVESRVIFNRYNVDHIYFYSDDIVSFNIYHDSVLVHGFYARISEIKKTHKHMKLFTILEYLQAQYRVNPEHRSFNFYKHEFVIYFLKEISKKVVGGYNASKHNITYSRDRFSPSKIKGPIPEDSILINDLITFTTTFNLRKTRNNGYKIHWESLGFGLYAPYKRTSGLENPLLYFGFSPKDFYSFLTKKESEVVKLILYNILLSDFSNDFSSWY